MSDVLICNSWDQATSTCSSFSLASEVHLIPLSQQELLELMSTGGFSPEAFQTAFTGFLGIWAAGLAVGIIVSQLRKLKP